MTVPPGMRRFTDKLERGEVLASDEMLERVRRIFEQAGETAMFEAMLADFERQGIDPRNPGVWQIAIEGGRRAAARARFERALVRGRKK